MNIALIFTNITKNKNIALLFTNITKKIKAFIEMRNTAKLQQRIASFCNITFVHDPDL